MPIRKFLVKQTLDCRRVSFRRSTEAGASPRAVSERPCRTCRAKPARSLTLSTVPILLSPLFYFRNTLFQLANQKINTGVNFVCRVVLMMCNSHPKSKNISMSAFKYVIYSNKVKRVFNLFLYFEFGHVQRPERSLVWQNLDTVFCRSSEFRRDLDRDWLCSRLFQRFLNHFVVFKRRH